ncbi:MAG: hypothetical protein J6O53_03180 [Eubacterium sp.]|nr:hypothetical protein [Eubacterium sp.]
MKRFGKLAVAATAVSALALASIPVFAAEENMGTSGISKVASIRVSDSTLEGDPSSVDGEDLKDELKDELKDLDWDKLKDEWKSYEWTDIDWGTGDIDLGELDWDDPQWEEDYGDLTEDEIKELKGIYSRYDEILEDVLGVDLDEAIDSLFSGKEDFGIDLTDPDLDKKLEEGFKKYEKELEELEKRQEELEKKAGWDFDITDEDGNPIASFSWDIDLDDLEKSLNISDENVEKAKGIWDKAKDLGLIDIITDKDTTDESIEKYVTEHSGELADLAEDAIDLLADILGEN